MKYLHATMNLPLSLTCGENGLIKCWVDTLYAVHPNMHGQAGVTMTMGQGSVYSNSTKHKLVAQSSTESQLICVHGALPQILWTCNFLTAQGYNMMGNVLYQDNKSPILLEENGRKLLSKWTKHIAV